MVAGINQALSNSFVGPVTSSEAFNVAPAEALSASIIKPTGSEPLVDSEGHEIDRKSIWGLYCVYFIIGIVNGFFATYFNTPTICQYVFGPMGNNVTDYTTPSQCNVAGTVYQLSWNFKLFFGIFLDIVPFFGSRRRGWMLFGWTGGLIMLGVVAVLVDNLVETHQFETYLYLMMAMCVFSTFSDVAGDGMIIEISKFEKDSEKGYILTTCQMMRFVMMMLSTGLGTLFMSGPSYQPKGVEPKAGALVFPWELSFAGIHWLLLGVSLPFYVGMWLWLKDPPAPPGHEYGICAGFKSAGGRFWTAMQSFAIFMLLIQAFGIQAIASMINPANSQIGSLAAPSNVQSGLGAFLGNVLFVAGVSVFRKFFLNKNWRFTLFMSQSLVALCSGLALVIVYDAFGFRGTSMDGWFYMMQANVPNFIQGIGQVVSSLAVIEVSPPGLEATIFEFLTSAFNGAISLSASLQTTFGHVFDLDDINYNAFKNNPELVPEYERKLATATIFALIVNLCGAAIFVWFMPKGPAQCREWAAKASFHNNGAALLNLVIFSTLFLYANVSVVLDIVE